MERKELVKYHLKWSILMFIVITCMYLLYSLLFVDVEAYAAEVDQESLSAIQEEHVADEELLQFGFHTEPQEQAYILTKIYNLLLTMFYFMIIYVGYKVIIRNMRKGKMNERID